MVGKVLHIEDTVFRMLPNPTIFYWDPTSSSIHTLMVEFIAWLKAHNESDSTLKHSSQVEMILKWAAKHIHTLSQHSHSETDVSNEEQINATHVLEEIAALRAGIKSADEYLTAAGTMPLTKQVLRVHIQEVLDILNEDDVEEEANGSEPTSMQNIDSASPSEKHRLLIEIYLSTVRKAVIQTLCDELTVGENARAKRLSAISSVTPDGTLNLGGAKDSHATNVNNIWCMLFFRMLCWLQLHDFHKKDLQISKSDVFQSRMPVYIV